jgi:hypothetical protein
MIEGEEFHMDQHPIPFTDAKERIIQELIGKISSHHLQPEDYLEVAALLEVLGWTDEQCQVELQLANVFELAKIVWQLMRNEVSISQFSPRKKNGWGELIKDVVHQFLRGVIFALPMAISVVSMLTLKFSLWSYEQTPVEVATSIGVGTILSFLLVGGFTQAIARRGFFYIMLGYYNMARRMTFYFIRVGFMISVLVSIVLYLTNLFFLVFPFSMVSLTIVYFFFLNMIWLSVTVFYILKKELVFTGLITLGIFLVWLMYIIFGIEVIVAQIVALAIIAIIGIILVLYYFRKAERKMDKGIEPNMPRKSLTVYTTMPYFVYGFFYFAFLFIDRFIAWSTPDQFIPYGVWFRNPYELGLDFALFALIIPMGMSEVIVSKIMRDIEASQKGYMGSQTEQMNRRFSRVYKRQWVIMVIISIVTAFLLYWFSEWFFTRNPQLVGIELFVNPITHFVFVWALVGYVLVSISLMNVVVLFSLSQARMITKTIIITFLTNLIIGFLATRWGHFLIGHEVGQNPGYSLAVFGLVCGSLVFIIMSTRKVFELLKKLDYYMYAAT